jgi:STAS domain
MTANDGPAQEPPRVVVDVGGYRKPDLVLVDVLARLRLVAGRRGARLVVLGASPELEQLLAFVGLLAVVPLQAEKTSELRREPEAREQPGVEEVVDMGDPVVAELDHLDAPGREPPAGPGLVLGEAG